MNSQSPKEVLLTSPLLHSQGGASTVLQHSHDKFKSVFDVTMAASSKRSLMAGDVAGHRRRLSCPSEVHPVSLLFDNQLHEDCFVIRFYSPNRNSALVGLFVLAMILVIASSIDLNLPRLDVPIFRVSLIIAASLSVASFVTATVNAAVHRKLLFFIIEPKDKRHRSCEERSIAVPSLLVVGSIARLGPPRHDRMEF